MATIIMASLDSVRQKIAWAKEHFKVLDAEELGYLRSDLCDLVIESNPHTKRQVQRLVIKIPIPEKIPLIIGDVVQNLRSALDYLVWQLVLAANNTPENCNQFPICTTPEAFAHATGKQRRLQGVSEPAAAVIESLQPYNTCKGRERANTLYILQCLSNADKHRRILVTVTRAAGWNTVIDSVSGAELPGFCTPRDHGTEAPIAVPGTRAGQKVQMQTVITPFIAFDEGLATDADIRIVLDSIRKSIENDLLPLFEPFFG